MNSHVPTQFKERGFTVFELMIVLMVMSILVGPFVFQEIRKFEQDRIEIAVAEINDLFQSAQNYAAEQDSQWPSEADNCASAITTLNTANYLQGFSLRSPFGTNLSTSCTTGDGKRFMVSIDAVSAGNAEVLKSYLPSSTVSGNLVTVSVPMPAAIPALKHLLPLDGSRPMTGDLEMDNNNILNANQIETETVLLNSIVTKDTACSTNGLVARDNVGNLLSCVSGQWQGPEGSPALMVSYFNAASCPDGWVQSDGRNGTLDLRGEFIRGWDAGRGIDAGRARNSFQGDEIRRHSHTQTTQLPDWDYGEGGVRRYTVGGRRTAQLRNDAAQPTLEFGGSETRPRNRAMLVCQKQP